MNAIKSNTLSIRILHFLVMFSYWMIIFGLLFTLTMLVLSVSGVDTQNMVLQYSFPVHFDVNEAGAVVETGESVSIVDATGKILFNSGAKLLINKLLIFMIIFFSISFLIVSYMRKFMKNIRSGIFFVLENMILLRKVSYALLGLWVLTVLIKIWFTFDLARSLQFESITLKQSLDVGNWMVIFPLFLLVLVNVFAEGIRLKSEEELTV